MDTTAQWKLHEPLAKYTTFKIGGPADYFFEATTTELLVQAVRDARKRHVPVFLLGGGTNILIGDKGIRGLVIKNAARAIAIRGIRGSKNGKASARTVFVEADAGVLMNALVRFTVDEGLSGLEMHLGLPGTVGGALYMNSKWTHPEGYVGDAVHQATLLTPAGEILEVDRSYFKFAYDTSEIQKTRDIVLSVVFSLSSQVSEKLWTIANESIAYRRASQPQGVKSAGCTFRNISKADSMTYAIPNGSTSAGFLIDHCGLKDTRIGDAQISSQHANFIVNMGHATASDVIQLIDRAKEQVKRRFGVTLTEEIERVGEF